MDGSGLPADKVLASALARYRAVHTALRKELDGLDATALNWQAAPAVNPIAVLVTHVAGSERAVLRLVRQVPNDRDRDAEFRASVDGVGELERLLDRADAELDEAQAAITADLLLALRSRGQDTHAGFHWLIENVAHAEGHQGQVSLLRNLYLARTDR